MKPFEHRFGSIVVAALAAAILAFFPPGHASAQNDGGANFTFALIGDLGYFSEHEPWVDNVFADLNKDKSLSFVAHVGDLSRPVLACTNEMVARRLAQFNGLVHPLVYTPGDNEWTDCHEPTVAGGDPLERLAHLRAVFFKDDRSLGKNTMALTRQSASPDRAFAKYRENARWERGGVTFLTLHLVGSNNGLGRGGATDEEYADRNRANLAWLRAGFEHARTQNGRAVMIITQANIFPRSKPAPKERSPSGFAEIRAALERETRAFGRPVVLVNGDSHYFRIDNPFRRRPRKGTPGVPAIETFTRVETFGTPNHHWLHVTVAPDNPAVFTFSPRIVAANVVKRR